jgi:hypothetical protein
MKYLKALWNTKRNVTNTATVSSLLPFEAFTNLFSRVTYFTIPNIAYCKNMGGVDLNDQICQYYDIICKSVKWWGNYFFHLLNMVIVNAYV